MKKHQPRPSTTTSNVEAARRRPAGRFDPQGSRKNEIDRLLPIPAAMMRVWMKNDKRAGPTTYEFFVSLLGSQFVSH